MNTPQSHNNTQGSSAVFAGVFAYVWWGLFPIYFKIIETVSATEILTHRIIWSVPFGLMILLIMRQWPQLTQTLKNKKNMFLLLIAAIAVAANWGIYIWAIQIDQIFQGSLGYYIIPLFYVIVGVVFLGERLSPWQGLAVFLALVGVLVLIFYGQVIPYIALFLAASFTLYGVIRKQITVQPMVGLFIETALLMPVALFYIYWLSRTGQFEFQLASLDLKILLLLAGPITVLPLLAFTVAAKTLKLSTLGFLQFIAPTLQFICGLYYGEIFTPAHAWCFGLIWLAVGIFSWDSWHQNKHANALPAR